MVKKTPSSTRSSPGRSRQNSGARANGKLKLYADVKPSTDWTYAIERQSSSSVLAAVDVDEEYPRFAAVLARDGDRVNVDELDILQHELEAMLVKNIRVQEQLYKLNALLSKEPLVEKATPDNADFPTVKRSHSPSTSTGGMSPKAKQARRDDLTSSPDQKAMSNGHQHNVNVAVPGYDALGRQRIYFWPQNHMPDKFWSFVDEHMATIEQSDVKHINTLLKEYTHDKLAKYYRVPGGEPGGVPNGKVEADDDDVKTSSTSKKRLSRHNSASNVSTTTASNGTTRTGKRVASVGETANLGELTEKLCQALVQTMQNGSHVSTRSSPLRHNGVDVKVECNGTSSNKTLIKSLNMGSMAVIERRIKKQMEKHGLLDEDASNSSTALSTNDESGMDEDDDEVLAELVERQAELRAVTTENETSMRAMVATATTAMLKAERVEAVMRDDGHVLDLFRTFYKPVPKRKPATKSEREQLWTAIETRAKSLKALHKCHPDT